MSEARQTQPPPSQQEEFIPIDQLPPQDQLPAAPLLVGAYVFVLLMLFGYMFSVSRRLDRDSAGSGPPRSRVEANRQELMPTAAHFIYIPGVLLVGIVIGWILGSRAAADAYAAKLRRQSRRRGSKPSRPRSCSAPYRQPLREDFG